MKKICSRGAYYDNSALDMGTQEEQRSVLCVVFYDEVTNHLVGKADWSISKGGKDSKGNDEKNFGDLNSVSIGDIESWANHCISHMRVTAKDGWIPNVGNRRIQLKNIIKDFKTTMDKNKVANELYKIAKMMVGNETYDWKIVKIRNNWSIVDGKGKVIEGGFFSKEKAEDALWGYQQNAEM